jgi:hypothetical protein
MFPGSTNETKTSGMNGRIMPNTHHRDNFILDITILACKSSTNF